MVAQDDKQVLQIILQYQSKPLPYLTHYVCRKMSLSHYFASQKIGGDAPKKGGGGK